MTWRPYILEFGRYSCATLQPASLGVHHEDVDRRLPAEVSTSLSLMAFVLCSWCHVTTSLFFRLPRAVEEATDWGKADTNCVACYSESFPRDGTHHVSECAFEEVMEEPIFNDTHSECEGCFPVPLVCRGVECCGMDTSTITWM